MKSWGHSKTESCSYLLSLTHSSITPRGVLSVWGQELSRSSDAEHGGLGLWWSKKEPLRKVLLVVSQKTFRSLFRCREVRPTSRARIPLKLTLLFPGEEDAFSFCDLIWNHWNWVCHQGRSTLGRGVWTGKALVDTIPRPRQGWQKGGSGPSMAATLCQP